MRLVTDLFTVLVIALAGVGVLARRFGRLPCGD
jgi:hypothetical protein